MAGEPQTEKGTAPLPLERQVLIAAGGLVLAGVLIPGMAWFSGAVGGGMVYAGFSGNCLIRRLLMKLPYNRTE